MRLTGGKVFDPKEGFTVRDLLMEGEKLTEQGGGMTIDLQGCYVIPGLTDLHVHGCMGADFSDGTPEGLDRIAAYQLSRGITQICPAGMTLSEEKLNRICRVAAAYRAGEGRAELVGVNLEGPFLCERKKGAQNGEYLRDPDPALLQRLWEASGGLVKLVTLACERPGAYEFIRTAGELGITVSLGHTEADYTAASAAFRAGARQVTHLFNAMPPFNHRDPGVAGAALDCPEVRVELIADGVHVHPSMVRAVFRMFGKDRVILVSDSLPAAGMPEGVYPFGGQEIQVRGERAVLCGQPEVLAGSVSDLMTCLKRAVSFGIPLADAVTAAAVNPAKALGIDHRLGSLEAGKDANLVVLDGDLGLRAVIFRGRVAAGSL